jgi:phosphatidylserine/phosphatidylglycerophosphate/cardiolipin synthase-like enzyme
MEFDEGRTCWRVERATSLSLIIDGKEYFRALREALIQARHRVLMIGWDFDFGIEMLPGESDDDGNAPDGLPNRIGAFLDELVSRCPQLDIYLLQWSGGVVLAPGQTAPALQVKFLSPSQVHLAFDGRHPVGACHHQKIVVVDSIAAFCGGIDVTDGRWDDRDHRSNNPLRAAKDGSIAQPWHDATAVLAGPAALALSELAHARWDRANDETLAPLPRTDDTLWPASITPQFRDIPVAIARTEPPQPDSGAICEIEALYLDAIASAREYIYFESQYFCADTLTAALKSRLAEEDGPEIIVINPLKSQNRLEDIAMNVPRDKMIRALQAADKHGRFAIFSPTNDAGEDIYVHAKIVISDGKFLRVGSSNIDRRSMGFDTECDIAVLASDQAEQDAITAQLHALLAEHLGTPQQEIAEARAKHGSLLKAIAALQEGTPPTNKRGLRPLRPRRRAPVLEWLAHTRIFDPRYQRSAASRIGISSRHILLAAGALIALLIAYLIT